MTLQQLYENFIALSQKYIVKPLLTLLNALYSWCWGSATRTADTVPIHESAINHEHQDCAGRCRPLIKAPLLKAPTTNNESQAAPSPVTADTVPLQVSRKNYPCKPGSVPLQAAPSPVTADTAPIHESAMNHEHQDCAGRCRPPAELMFCSPTLIQSETNQPETKKKKKKKSKK